MCGSAGSERNFLIYPSVLPERTVVLAESILDLYSSRESMYALMHSPRRPKNHIVIACARAALRMRARAAAFVIVVEFGVCVTVWGSLVQQQL
eukprot:COSAG02_NODE_1962_length_10253_cov_6.942294_10_plen_93_part_00